MNLDKLVAAGEQPWLPSRQAAELDVWYEYEYPLAGTFELEDQVVLFTNINGAHDRLSVWAYACVSGDEASRWDELCFETPEDLHAFIDEQFQDREVCFALASNLKIKHWSRYEVSDGLLDTATKFLERLLKASTPSANERFNASLSALDELDEGPNLVGA